VRKLDLVANGAEKLFSTIVAARRADDAPALVADPSRAAKVLGWRAEQSLQQMIETAYQWHSGQWAVGQTAHYIRHVFA